MIPNRSKPTSCCVSASTLRETNFADVFYISRITARQAIADLKADNQLFSAAGKAVMSLLPWIVRFRSQINSQNLQKSYPRDRLRYKAVEQRVNY